MTPKDRRRFMSKVALRPDGCRQWTGGIGSGGYGVFWMDGRQHRAARLALLMDGQDGGPGLMACHTCDNRACVRPLHLYWGTHADNMHDRAVRGRTARGDRMPHKRVHGSAHPRSKVNEEIVRDIRSRYRLGLGGALMREYGLSQATLWAIVNGRSWRHVQ